MFDRSCRIHFNSCCRIDMKQFVKNVIKNYIYYSGNRSYDFLYKKIIASNPELGKIAEGEKEWLMKWRRYDSKLSPLSYRIFSRYIGEDMNILPLELCVNVIEPVLTPSGFREFYSDKNVFDKYIPREYFPKVVLRNIRGVFYDENYNLIWRENVDKYLSDIKLEQLVIKPSLMCSGVGVQILSKDSDGFRNKDGDVLSLRFLTDKYGSDYLVQECFQQSEVTSFFNTSSVNTIRIATYRDQQGVSHVLNAILRIGAKGTNVDNAHAGGMFCGISKDGKIGSYVCDWLGRKKNIFNEIDFSKGNYWIPNFDKVREFAVNVAKYIIHHDLIAFDIVLDENNIPKLLEINVGGFSGWLFQFTSGTVFEEYTDEVMEYCMGKSRKLKVQIIYG